MTELTYASTEEIVAEIERRNYVAVMLCIVEDRRTDDTCKRDEDSVTCYVAGEEEDFATMRDELRQYVLENHGDD